MMNNIATDIDDYISNFPMDIRNMLQEVRVTIAAAAPKATEAIKYAMPTFVYKGNLVHFAAFKNHIGFYPAPTGIVAFAKELAPYKQGKGSIQFPIDEPIPLRLIAKIVQWRVKDNEGKALAKKKSK